MNRGLVIVSLLAVTVAIVSLDLYAEEKRESQTSTKVVLGFTRDYRTDIQPA
jgi:hypothetical protein